MPTKKRLWNVRASPTTASVPAAMDAIPAVMVSPGSSGLVSNSAPPDFPAAMKTIIVSPSARDTAMMSEATTPDKAAGNTTRTTVVTFFAPNP